MTYSSTTRSFLFGILGLLLLIPAAHAQVNPNATLSPYSTTGFSLHLRTSGHGMAFDGPSDADGMGLGLRLSYGFSERFAMYLGAEGAGLDGGRGLEGLGSKEEYGVAYVELGGRYSFRPTQRLVPYADASLTIFGLGYDGTGSFDDQEITYGGLGLSMGGGVQYFITPTLALDTGMSFTPGSLLSRWVEDDHEDIDLKLVGARIHFGISVFPFR
ncbi:MAG: hypothetical protein RhofKO_34950 [Rhodothermales bacterium]